MRAVRALLLIMGLTVSHSLSATTPNDPAFEIQPQHWNSRHAFTLNAVGSEVSGAFANGGGITFGLSTDGFITATVATNYAGTNGAITGGSITVNTSGVSVNLPAYLTTAMLSSAATISNMRVSAGTTSNLLSALTFSNSNGISFGLDASTITASHNGLTSQSNQNVTAGNGGFAFQTLSFSNANGISFGTSAGSAITGSHNAITTARGSTDAIGLNTAQTNVTWTANSSGLSFNAGGYAGTTSGFAGANISGSMTHNSVGLNLSLSVAAPGAAAENNNVNLLGANTVGNTTASGSTIGYSGLNLTLSGTNNSQVVISAPATSSLVGTGGISISTNGSTISVSYKPVNRSAIEIVEGEMLTHAISITGGSYSKRPIFVPFWLDGENLSVKTVDFWASRPAGTSLNMTYGIGFYSMVNSTQISLVSSTTNAISVTASAQFSGVRRYQITGLSAFTLSEGRWLAALYFSGSNNSTAVANLVVYGGQTMFGVDGYVHAGTNSTGATSGSEHAFPFWGVYASTTAGFPGSVARSEISGHGSNNVNADPYLVIREI